MQLITSPLLLWSSVNYGMVPQDADRLLAGACPIIGSYGAKSHQGSACRLRCCFGRAQPASGRARLLKTQSQRIPPAHTGSVDCEERERLIKIHLDAVAKLNEARKGVPEPRPVGWRKVWYKTRNKARLICRKTLEDLNRHKAAHGC
jgi:hypothetical protein